MDIKNSKAAQTTKTYNRNEIESQTDNIYEAISIISKRAEQIKGDIKKELIEKLEEFATNNDQLEEVFENTEQIAVSRYYERLPKPWSIALKELSTNNIYIRDVEESSDSPESLDA